MRKRDLADVPVILAALFWGSHVLAQASAPTQPPAPVQPPAPAQDSAEASAESTGAAIYAARCASCHDAPDSHAPPQAALRQMPAARILRTMDFGTMMSVTYMLDRDERETVAAYLGTSSEDTSPPASAYCDDREVRIAASASDWNGWSPSPTNTRYQAAAGGIDETNVSTLALQWAFAFDGDVNAFAPATVLGEQLFVGSAGGSVHALDAATGCIRWHYQAEGPVRTAIRVAPLSSADSGDDSGDGSGDGSSADSGDGSGAGAGSGAERHALMFGDQIGWFYVVEAQTGRLLWKTKPEAHEATKLTGAPLAHEGVVYVPVASWEESRPLNPAYPCCTFRGSVVAYGIEDGVQRWKSYLVTEEPVQTGETPQGVPQYGPSGLGTWSAPTLDVERNLLYVTTGNNYTGMTPHSDAVVALDIDSGRIVWSQQVTPGDEFNLYCRSRGGCPGEDFDFGASAVLAKAPNGRDVLIAGQKSGLVYALDPDDRGALLWQARVGEGGINGGVLWGMASDADNVYVSVSDLARTARADSLAYDWRPTGVDPSKGGGLTALRLVDGGRAWYAAPSPCDPARPVCSPAQPSAVTAIPGVVFSGAVDGYLRAFSAEDGRVIWEFDTAREFETVNGIAGRGGSIDGDGAVVAGGRVYITSGYARNGGMPGNVLLAFAKRGSAPF